MKQNYSKLPDGELEVMMAIWKCQIPAEREEILSNMNKDTLPAITTLLTILTRLNDKGYIRIIKNGRRSCYIPIVSHQEYLSMQSRSFLERLCDGRISLFANALCDCGLTKQELKELAKRIEGNDPDE